MKDEIHDRLDGEGSGHRIESNGDSEALAWDGLLEAFRTEMSGAPPPPWLETRVMAEIEALPEPGMIRRLGRWLIAPRPMRVSPLLAGGATAVIALALLVGRTPAPDGIAVEENGVVYVQFALDAPGAQTVTVTGDFDAWEGSHALEDLDGDGLWTARVPVRPGVHAYMFLVDGSSWRTDPRAERYAEDGFGNRNAILAVAAPSA